MGSNSLLIGAVCVAIGLLNVFLNISIKRAADQSGGFWENFFSLPFLFAFFVGVVSLTSIFTLYSLKVDLGRGILLMGASSIVGGSLIGLVFFGSDLKSWEKGLLALIALFYILKMLGK